MSEQICSRFTSGAHSDMLRTYGGGNFSHSFLNEVQQFTEFARSENGNRSPRQAVSSGDSFYATIVKNIESSQSVMLFRTVHTYTYPV